MAEFGATATQLSEPRGAGANVVAPVQTRDTRAAFLEPLVSIADIFAKGLENDSKQKAEAAKNGVIKQFSEEQEAINQGIANGTLKADEAAVRSRRLASRYLSGYSQYGKELKAAIEGFKSATELGDAEKAEATAREDERRLVQDAEKAGHIFYKDMSPQAKASALNAFQVERRAQVLFEQYTKERSELRTEDTYQKGLLDRRQREDSIQVINHIASAKLTEFQDLATDLAAKVKGGLDPAQARDTLGRFGSNIEAAIQAAAQLNPELAAPYRTLFANTLALNMKALDPNQNAEDLKNQFNALKTKAALMAAQNPKILAAIVSTELFPMNPTLMTQVGPEAVAAFATISTNPVGAGAFVPQIVGNPETEKQVVDVMKESLKTIKSNQGLATDKAIEQTSNAFNHLLTQVGKQGQEGINPSSLREISSVLSNPLYADLVKKGKISPVAQAQAWKIFQLNYEPVVIQGVQQKLDKELYQAAFRRDGVKQNAPIKIKDAVDVSFTGAGVIFSPKKMIGLDDVERASQMEAVRGLQKAQEAVNQLIHLSTHLSGTTDYMKNWEENKHIYLPMYFTKEDTKSKPMGSVKTEAGMKEAVKLTPEEEARSAAFERSAGNIAELKSEIAKAKSPEIKRILETELARLEGR
jgi:hypothetical protein